jgi:Na+/proline symporter
MDPFWWTFMFLVFLAYIFTVIAIGTMVSKKKEETAKEWKRWGDE